MLGVPVIRGEVSTRAASKVAPHLPAIATLASSWPGAVIADVGCLQPGNPALVVAKSASIVLLVMRASTEGLGHLRDRVDELAAYVGDPSRDWTSVGVVLVAGPREETAAVARTRGLLDSIGSPAPVVGVFRHDPAAAAALWAGPAEPSGSRRGRWSARRRSWSRSMWTLWPQVLSATSYQPPPVSSPSRRGRGAAVSTPAAGGQQPLDHRLIRQLQARVAEDLNRESQRREAVGEPELSRADEQQLSMTLIDRAVTDYMQQQLRDGRGRADGPHARRAAVHVGVRVDVRRRRAAVAAG